MLSPNNSTPGPLAAALIRKERDGAPGANFGNLLAEGDGWRVLDLVCTAGPHDRAFEERHAWTSISLVLAGMFTYRSERGSSLMSSGALLLGSLGRRFECSHQHGAGDRCVSFQFTPALFEGIARDAGTRRAALYHDRIPPLRALAPLSARIKMALDQPTSIEEIGIVLAAAVVRIDADAHCESRAVGARESARIAAVLHYLEAALDERHTLADLARMAGLSRYHFLRTFKRVTGVTPHQWILRARLREASRRLTQSHQPITDIALEVGFEDLSNFIRSFRAEFGISPRSYRISMS